MDLRLNKILENKMIKINRDKKWRSFNTSEFQGRRRKDSSVIQLPTNNPRPLLLTTPLVFVLVHKIPW